MANPEHVKLLKQGVYAWNAWLRAHPILRVDINERIDLSGADLKGINLSQVDLTNADLRKADLSEADLSKAFIIDGILEGANLSKTNLREATLYGSNLTSANLEGADLTKADLIKVSLFKTNLKETRLRMAQLRMSDLSYTNLILANLHEANLSMANLTMAKLNGANLNDSNLTKIKLVGANLSEAYLVRANLSKANLSSANLSKADFSNADLSDADLSHSNLREANLNYANLSRANLTKANLEMARFGNTILGRVDLSNTIGLKDAHHSSSSHLGNDTIQFSRGNLPLAFMRGCGLSDWEIESAKLYNPELSNEGVNKILYKMYDLRASQAIQISPLFISYSHDDGTFVDKLESHLNKKGVRFWRDIHDAKAGRLEKQIDQAIRQNPTVLLILSSNSIKSDWVEHEVHTARGLEKEIGRDILCPIALDDGWKKSPWPKRVMEQVMEYNILDFSTWEDDGKFGNTFNKLIDGLGLFYKSN